MSKNYWDLTDRPHTERKLVILEKYIKAWAKILFNQWKNKRFCKNFRTIYYVDCFAGRGKYHKDGKLDLVDGSPLIALKCAKTLQREFSNKVELKCIFIEENPSFVKNLKKFCKAYKNDVDYYIYEADVNQKIGFVIKKIKSNAAFFFIDPWRLSNLDSRTVEAIIDKKGGKDIVLNYICGANRVVGVIKKMITQGKITDKTYKYLDSIEKFHTLPVLKQCINKSDREKLQCWAKEILKGTNLKYKTAYEMMSSSKKEPVYYLLFASRAKVAEKIMRDIFKKEDLADYSGQQKLFSSGNFDI